MPVWQPVANVKAEDEETSHVPIGSLDPPEFPSFSVEELIKKGTLLLSSSGKEFQKPTGILSSSSEVKKARKEAMGRLGLDFLESVGGADDMDLEKELAADEDEQEDVDMEPVVKKETTSAIKIEPTASFKTEESPVSPTDSLAMSDIQPTNGKVARASPRPNSATPAPVASGSNVTLPSNDDLSGLSARERNRLKRKRKPGNSAFVAAPPPQNTGARYNATSTGASNK